MLRLASLFKPASLLGVLLGALLGFFPGPAPSWERMGGLAIARAQAPKFEKSDDEKDMETHEKKTRAGVKIAPPPGASSPKADAKGVDDLFRSLPDDVQSDGEISLPAEGLGMELVGPEEAERKRLEKRRRDFNLRSVDEEQSGGRGSLDERHTRDLSDIERKLGVESESDEAQKAPSFTLTVQKIKDQFRARDYEEAVITLADLMRHYPRSPQLLVMKGTLHQKLGQIDLSLQAYQRAFEYEPSKRLKAQIDHLKRLQAERERLRPRREGIVTPLGIEDATFVRKPGAPASAPATPRPKIDLPPALPQGAK